MTYSTHVLRTLKLIVVLFYGNEPYHLKVLILTSFSLFKIMVTDQISGPILNLPCHTFDRNIAYVSHIYLSMIYTSI
jgi:hypothetical protein